MVTARHAHDQIVIVGAGIAGLAAGRRLCDAGLSPLIIEARPRVGGRVLTDRSRGIVEAGAEFIHGKRAATWEFINAASLSTAPWPPEELKSADDAYLHACHGRLLPADGELHRRIDELYGLAEGYDGPEQSVTDFMARLASPDDPAAKFALRRLANIENADVTRLSVQALGRERRLDTAGWGDNFHVTEGYDALAPFLDRGLDIRCDTAVRRIDWDETGAELFLYGGETIRARQVILTVPLGLLQAGLPEFRPSLPVEKQNAIGALAMGCLAKLILWFDRSFWPPFAFLGTDGMVPTWWPVYPAMGAILMGYIGGPAANLLASLGAEAAVRQGLAEVTALFGSAAGGSFIRGEMVDWSADPWTQGGYSYTPVGAGDARARLAAPVGGTLFFAGEATCTNGHAATVHGAIESGRRAAGEVMEERAVNSKR